MELHARFAYRGLGMRGLPSRERLRDDSRDLHTAPDDEDGDPTHPRSTDVSRSIATAFCGFEHKDEAALLSNGPLLRFASICMRLTPADGVVSRRSAEATPGARCAVEKSGRCSRVTRAAIDDGRADAATFVGEAPEPALAAA